MKYRLYDIDALIKRTLVYVPLTTLVIGLYSAIVSLLGKLFQRSSNSTVSSLIATGIVAVLFQPLREQLQNLVNRHLYGERDDPIGVITKLAGQVEDEDVLLNLLPTFIETIASLLKLPYVALQVADPAEAGQPLISTGEQPAEVEVLPLSYQGKQIGQLTVAPRAPGELFSQAEQRLLTTIAHLTATIVHTIQLTDALQESRLRVVTSREEERRRIRRDLHDGLGPTLASQTLKLDTLLETLADHPQIAMEIKSLKGQTQQMVADIRRLVYALRPPALDELGLLEALRAHIAQMDGLGQLQISIMAEPDPLPALPAALEVVTYRTTLEAVTNVIRHAAADHCQISFKIDSLHLTIIINDNGVGLPLDYTAGVGLISMRERAEELGGTCQIESNNRSGTQVMVTLPLINLREPK